MAPKVLVVLSSANKWVGGKNEGNPTGWYLPEFAHPYDVLKAKGVEFTVASPKGGEAPVDPGSVEMFKDDSSQNFYKNPIWKNTVPLKDVVGTSDQYDAVFYPGGHGPLFDLHTDEDSQKLIQEFYNAGKPVAAVCHGPIVFAEVKIGDKYLVDGKKVTGFTNEEEEAFQLTEAVPVLLETRLKERGGKWENAPKLESRVVVDGQLITGQNPASAGPIGEAIATAIGV